MTIKAVTFDLWATVWYDLHDRQRNERRAAILYDGLRSAGIGIDREAPLEAVYECALYAEVSRRRGGEDFLPQQQVDRMLRRLGVDEARAGGPAAFEALTAAIRTPYEDALLEVPPTLIPGVREAVAALGGRYRLGMVSNAGASPGRVLRLQLERFGLADGFDFLGFSDEFNLVKPHPRFFLAVLQELGVSPAEAVHVGDNPVADVGGARGAGLKAVWFCNREFAQGSVLSRVNEIAGGLNPMAGDGLVRDLDRAAAGLARGRDAAPGPDPWGVDPAQVTADAVIGQLCDLPAAVRRLDSRH